MSVAAGPKTDSEALPEQRLVNEWNARHQVGVRVAYWPVLPKVGRPVLVSFTRSEAWLMGGHTAVVLVEGQSGAVLLRHLELATEVMPPSWLEPLALRLDQMATATVRFTDSPNGWSFDAQWTGPDGRHWKARGSNRDDFLFTLDGPDGKRQVAGVDRGMRMARLVEAAEICGALPEANRGRR